LRLRPGDGGVEIAEQLGVGLALTTGSSSLMSAILVRSVPAEIVRRHRERAERGEPPRHVLDVFV
jgi:hypothetical protein